MRARARSLRVAAVLIVLSALVILGALLSRSLIDQDEPAALAELSVSEGARPSPEEEPGHGSVRVAAPVETPRGPSPPAEAAMAAVRVVVSAESGEPIAGALVSATRTADGSVIDSGRTNAAGVIEVLPVPVAGSRLVASAAGFSRESLELEPKAAAVQFQLARAQLVSGRCVLKDGTRPNGRPWVVAYRRAADLAALTDVDRARLLTDRRGDLETPGHHHQARNVRGLHVTRSEPDGSFEFVELKQGRRYGLAAAGDGMVSTAGAQWVEAGETDVEVAVAYLYGARVTGHEAAGALGSGRPVPIFDPTTYGWGGLSWHLVGESAQLVRSQCPGLILAGFSKWYDRERGPGRVFLATSSAESGAVGPLALHVEGPTFVGGVARVDLPRVVLEPVNRSVELVRTNPCLGALRIRFESSGPGQIPAARVHLHDEARGTLQSIGLHETQRRSDGTYLIQEIPCGPHALRFESEFSGFRWPGKAETTTIVVESGRETLVSIPVASLCMLEVRLFGALGAAAQEGRGVLLAIGEERINRQNDPERSIRANSVLPVEADTIQIPGLKPGRYVVVAYDGTAHASAWVDVSQSCGPLELGR